MSSSSNLSTVIDNCPVPSESDRFFGENIEILGNAILVNFVLIDA